MKMMIAGLGHIGSYLTRLAMSLLNAQPGDGHQLSAVDHDSYNASNLASQLIDREDIGRNKAKAQLRKYRHRRSQTKIIAHARRLEHLPLGSFSECDVVFTCLDSKAARVLANSRIYKAGVPIWIDVGIARDDRLARVSVYYPRDGGPCLECGWGDEDYAGLEVAHPCGDIQVPTTSAPAALGALAASLGVLAIEEELARRDGDAREPREIIVRGPARSCFVSRLHRDPCCRFDHSHLEIQSSDIKVGEATLGTLWKQLGANGAALQVEGSEWLTSFICPSCRIIREGLALRGRGTAETIMCPACHTGRLLPSGFHQKTAITRSEVESSHFDTLLSALGLRPGEVISIIRHGQIQKTFLLA